MNGAHWHLVVNHLPIVFPIVGIIIMLIGILSKSEHIKRTALFIFIRYGMTRVPNCNPFIDRQTGADRQSRRCRVQ